VKGEYYRVDHSSLVAGTTDEGRNVTQMSKAQANRSSSVKALVMHLQGGRKSLGKMVPILGWGLGEPNKIWLL
jgi:hypothetical protein